VPQLGQQSCEDRNLRLILTLFLFHLSIFFPRIAKRPADGLCECGGAGASFYGPPDIPPNILILE